MNPLRAEYCAPNLLSLIVGNQLFIYHVIVEIQLNLKITLFGRKELHDLNQKRRRSETQGLQAQTNED